MPWYDLFSSFYDLTVEPIYRPYRAQVVEALALQPGDAVLDLACGTGPNLPHLASAMGEDGLIFGVDFSEGMVRRAKARATRAGWTNVHLLQRDARALTVAELEALCGAPVQLTHIIVTLGLSVIPDWTSVLDATFALLAPGGRYVIFDVYADRRVPQSWIVERMAEADLSRRTWEHLETLCEDFSFTYLPGSPHIHGGRPFMASGRRPA